MQRELVIIISNSLLFSALPARLISYYHNQAHALYSVSINLYIHKYKLIG
jgi:hypothetical protein